MNFYSYTKNNIKFLLNNYYSQYKNYLKDKEKNKFNNLYLLIEKYNINDLEIVQIVECKKDELKQKLNDYIKNDNKCINKKFSQNNDKLKENQIKSINNWRINNIEKRAIYNKEYYKVNIDKARTYYDKTKEFVYEKALCLCGKYYLHNRKANRSIHNNTKHHMNYINSLN